MNKGPGEVKKYDASKLRVGIIHSRWNAPVIEALLSGARKSLLEAGVQPSNIITQTVPGSYELPFAVQRMYTASTSSQASGIVSAATDLLSSGTSQTDLTKPAHNQEDNVNRGPLDAIIAIGVLIKGSTMHFEYIADAVSHGLMRVQIDLGVPIIFGVLTCLSEEQAYTRAGLKGQGPAAADKGADQAKLSYAEQGHNHGEDWGNAAVEMGIKRQGWAEGKFVD